jgi:hypothetical protein
MKKIFASATTFFAYLVALLVYFFVFQQTGDVIIPASLAALFSIAALFFIGRAYVFVLSSVFFLTVVLPIAFLTITIRPLEDSYSAAFFSLIANLWTLPMHGLVVLLPLLVSAVVMTVGSWWLGPNNSFKPNPLRGSA